MSAPNATLPITEAHELKRDLPRDVEALHAVQATRPLKPPPYRFEGSRLSPAAVEAKADRKRGLV
jgi:hypothetical protein